MFRSFECSDYSTLRGTAIYRTASRKIRQPSLRKYVGSICWIWRTGSSCFVKRLNHIPDTVWRDEAHNLTHGLDQLSADLSRGRHVYFTGRSTTRNTALYRRHTSQGTGYAIPTRKWRAGNYSRKPGNSPIRLGTLSRPQPSSTTDEIFRRHFFRVQIDSLCSWNYCFRASMHLWRQTTRSRQSQQNRELGSMRKPFGRQIFPRNHWCMSTIH